MFVNSVYVVRYDVIIKVKLDLHTGAIGTAQGEVFTPK